MLQTGTTAHTTTQQAVLRSDNKTACRELVGRMVSKIDLNNTSESVDTLMDALRKSEYYDKL